MMRIVPLMQNAEKRESESVLRKCPVSGWSIVPGDDARFSLGL
jgi:hypothetical protein